MDGSEGGKGQCDTEYVRTGRQKYHLEGVTERRVTVGILIVVCLLSHPVLLGDGKETPGDSSALPDSDKKPYSPSFL